MDLADWLMARIAEDEAAARATRSRKWDAVADGVEADDSDGELPNDLICEVDDWNRGIDGEPTLARAAHIARHDPARVLAECEAKRAIVEAYRDERSRRDIYQRDDAMAVEDEEQRTSRRSSAARTRGLEIAVEALALPYASHADYDESWRP